MGSGVEPVNYQFNSLLHAATVVQVHHQEHLDGKTIHVHAQTAVRDNEVGLHCHQSLWKDGAPRCTAGGLCRSVEDPSLSATCFFHAPSLLSTNRR